MGLIDLHVHSDASDGTLTPSQLAALAAAKKLTAFALTDHDTVDGIAEAVAAAEGTGVEVVPGTELSCLYRGKEIHILGLFLHYTDERLLQALERQRKSRDLRNEEIIRLLTGDGMPVTREELQAGQPDTVITRAHFARVLLEKGYVSSTEQAFTRYLGHGKKYCPPKAAFTPEAAISLIRGAGGFAAVAHPVQYKLGFKETEAMIVEFMRYGLEGIEVFYSSHREFESRKLREICLAHDLLPTGGSDFHGSNKPDIGLGCGRGGLKVSSLLLEDIKKRMRDRA